MGVLRLGAYLLVAFSLSLPAASARAQSTPDTGAEDQSFCMGPTTADCCPVPVSSDCVIERLQASLSRKPNSNYSADNTLLLIDLMYRLNRSSVANRLTREYVSPRNSASGQEMDLLRRSTALARILINAGETKRATAIVSGLVRGLIPHIGAEPLAGFIFGPFANIADLPEARKMYALTPAALFPLTDEEAKAVRQILSGNTDEARKTTFAILRKEQDKGKQSRPPVYLVRLLLLTGNTSDGLTLADEIESTYVKPEDFLSRQYLEQLAVSLGIGGQYGRAISTAQKIPPLKRRWGTSITEKIRALANTAEFAAAENRMDDAVAALKAMVANLQRIPDETAYGEFMVHVIGLMCKIGQFEMAKETALVAEKALDRPGLRGHLVKRMAESAWMLGDAGGKSHGKIVLERALELHREASSRSDSGSKFRFYHQHENLLYLISAHTSLDQLDSSAFFLNLFPTGNYSVQFERLKLAGKLGDQGQTEEAVKQLSTVLRQYGPDSGEHATFELATEVAHTLHKLGM